MFPATLPLEALAAVPALPRGSHIAILQKCCVCFDNQGFASGLHLLVECNFHKDKTTGQAIFQVTWEENVDDELRGAHADLNESVEDSAKAIGILLISKLTPYNTCRQALRGTHIDYYLVDANATLPFQTQSTAGVEFTGIIAGDEKIVQRIKDKYKRLHKLRDFPIFIVCVEHNFPIAYVEKVDP